MHDILSAGKWDEYKLLSEVKHTCGGLNSVLNCFSKPAARGKLPMCEANVHCLVEFVQAAILNLPRFRNQVHPSHTKAIPNVTREIMLHSVNIPRLHNLYQINF